MAVPEPLYYGVRIYIRVQNLRLYPSPNDIPADGLSRHFRLPPTLLGFIKRFEIEKVVRANYYPAGFFKAGSRRMECIVRDGVSHTGYCRYS